MGKKFILLPIWFSVVLLTLTSALFLEYTITRTQGIAKLIKTYHLPPEHGGIGGLSQVPRAAGEILGALVTHDARPAILEQFLRKYNSPLVGHARYFIEIADKYNLDYRLLPAIAMQESGGGKIIRPGSYNAWGYGITENQTLHLGSWDQAIEIVAKGLARNYIAKGLITPEQIMTKYTPASLEKGGAWAKGVRFFMEQMQ